MASAGDEDLVASKTDGFKVGEKKTVEEYAKLGEPFPNRTSSVVRRHVLQVASTWDPDVAAAPSLCVLSRLFRCFNATSIFLCIKHPRQCCQARSVSRIFRNASYVAQSSI